MSRFPRFVPSGFPMDSRLPIALRRAPSGPLETACHAAARRESNGRSAVSRVSPTKLLLLLVLAAASAARTRSRSSFVGETRLTADRPLDSRRAAAWHAVSNGPDGARRNAMGNRESMGKPEGTKRGNRLMSNAYRIKLLAVDPSTAPPRVKEPLEG